MMTNKFVPTKKTLLFVPDDTCVLIENISERRNLCSYAGFFDDKIYTSHTNPSKKAYFPCAN